MNGTQFRMLATIKHLRSGMILLLVSVLLNIFFSESFGYGLVQPFQIEVPAELPTNLVFYNGISQTAFVVAMVLLAVTGIMYVSSFYFFHKVYGMNNNTSHEIRLGNLGLLILFLGLLVLILAFYFLTLCSLLYADTFNQTITFSFLNFFVLLGKHVTLFEIQLSYVFASILIFVGFFIIASENFKLSMKFSSPMTAVGSIALLSLGYFICTPSSLSSSSLIFLGIMRYLISIVSVGVLLAGFRDITKKTKDERSPEISIYYLS